MSTAALFCTKTFIQGSCKVHWHALASQSNILLVNFFVKEDAGQVHVSYDEWLQTFAGAARRSNEGRSMSKTVDLLLQEKKIVGQSQSFRLKAFYV